MRDVCDESETDPTPDEIAERCRAIRAGWTPWQERRRVVVKPTPYTVPRINDAHLPDASIEPIGDSEFR